MKLRIYNKFVNHFRKRDFNFKLKFFILFPIICILIIFDNFTKIIAKNNLIEEKTIKFIPHFINFQLITNRGSAYGNNSNNFELTIILAVLMTLICIIGFLFFYEPLYIISFTLLVAGDLGNLINRIWNNAYVIDFLSWEFIKPYFIFNFADMFITFGVILFIFSLLFIEFWLEPRFNKKINKEDMKKNVRNKN